MTGRDESFRYIELEDWYSRALPLLDSRYRPYLVAGFVQSIGSQVESIVRCATTISAHAPVFICLQTICRGTENLRSPYTVACGGISRTPVEDEYFDQPNIPACTGDTQQDHR